MDIIRTLFSENSHQARPPDGRATRTLTLDKGRLTEREMTDSAAQDANAVPDGADENEETQA